MVAANTHLKKMEISVLIVQVLQLMIGAVLIYGETPCDIFNDNSLITNANGSPVTLNFSISTVCSSEYVRVQTIHVRKKSAFGGHQFLCLFAIEDGTCVSPQSPSCTCDPKSRAFSVTTTVDRAGDAFIIIAQLENGETFNETVKIQAILTSTIITQTTSPSSINDVGSSKPKVATTAADQFTSNVVSTETIPRETNKVRGSGSTISKGTLLAVIVASCTAVLLAIVLVVTCRLRKSLAAIQKRRSWTGFGLNQAGHIAPRNPYVVPNIFYGGSNVSLNIVNDIYQSSMDVHTAAVPKLSNPCDRDVPPRCGAAVHVLPGPTASIDAVSDEEGDYAEINNMETACNEGACGGDDVYISVEEIRRRKAEQQKQK